MQVSKILLVAIFGLTFNLSTVQCFSCNFISHNTGIIESRIDVLRDSWFRRCWELTVDGDYVLHMKVAQFDIVSEDICQTNYWDRTTENYWDRTTENYWDRTTENYWDRTTSNYWDRTTSNYYDRTTSNYWDRTTTQPYFDYRRAKLIVQDEYNGVNYTFHPSKFNKDLITIRGDTNITLEVNNQYNWCIAHKITFRLEFSKVTGIETIKGIVEARHKVVNWMKKQISPPLKWHDDIEKTVIALHLSDEMNFSKTGLVEEMLIKQVDLKSSVALLRNKSDIVSLNKLAKIINSLLVTCHNPRKFYGYDLVKMAKENLEGPSWMLSPLAYIALCNANETLSEGAVKKLLNIVREHEIYPFSQDISALGFMALSCIRNRQNEMREFTEDHYNETLAHLKMQQQEDGSFGNIYSTAIVTQALMSSNAGNQSSLNDSDSVFPAIRFLINHLNSSDFGLMAAYYTLPILNGKTLLDIGYTDCSRNPRKNRDDIIDNFGEKIKVQYSLIIGDKEDITNTISLRVPDNITAYEMMQIAQTIEPKYKFEWKRTSRKMYVYEIASIPVDPEEGRFWLTYFKHKSTELTYVPEGPDTLQLHDGYHLIQWYKSVHV